MLLVGLVAARKQPPALQLDQGRGDDQELGRDLEVEALHRLDLGQEGIDDVSERDLVQVDPLLADQPQQQIERPCEDVGVDLVCHQIEVTGQVHARGRIPRASSRRHEGVPGILQPMPRVFSGVQSSGAPHVGNYFGAFRQWVADQYSADSFFCVVDLHSLTIDHDPALSFAAAPSRPPRGCFATGLDPDVCTVFVQSHVHEHTELSGCSSAPPPSASCAG